MTQSVGLAPLSNYGSVGYGCVGPISKITRSPYVQRGAMTTSTLKPSAEASARPAIENERGPKPLTEGKQPAAILIGLWAFVVLPFVALLAAVPFAWGGWLGWTDVAIFVPLYLVAGLGITVGFHRYLTHSSFKATRWLDRKSVV